MKTSLFDLPTVSDRAAIEKGLVGVGEDLYQAMLREVSERARLADDLGYERRTPRFGGR